MVPCWDYASEQDFEPNRRFGGFLLLLNPVWESSTLLDATSSLEKVVSVPQNLSGRPLVRNIANLSFWASLSKVVCRHITFLPTLSQGERTSDSCVAIDHLRWPLLACYLLELYLVPIHWIHLACLTLRWPSSSTLFVALNLVDSIAPNCYLGKVILHLPMISHIKASIHHVIELKLEDIHVIHEFPDMFPDDMPRM
jgi:hypothetical protein